MEQTEERRLPPPDRYAVCPGGDDEILEFYDGVFESVYVLLHPFLRPKSVPDDNLTPDVYRCEEGPAAGGIAVEYSGDYPSKLKIIEDYEAVRWKEVIERTDLKCISQVDIGLRTGIVGLRADLANKKYDRALNSLEPEIIRPREGDLPALLENKLFESVKSLGYRWLWIGDEFCTERKLHWIDDLMEIEEIGPHGNVFTPDHDLLITTHWDSHFSLVCSSRSKIDAILDEHSFEGFFCQSGTTIYWSVDEGGG